MIHGTMRDVLFGSPALSVLPFAESDLPEVLRVYKQCEDFLALGPVATASLEMVREDVRHSREEGGSYCVIRTAAGETAGILDFLPRHGPPGTAYLSLLMIESPFRGRGIGSETVALLEAHLREWYAVHTVESGVQVNNEPGIRFWTGQGYRIVSGPELMPDTTVTCRLRKEI
jgi:ribosomal protein S18 acetylase RimI-like enzyme